jgi:hypothetical protein
MNGRRNIYENPWAEEGPAIEPRPTAPLLGLGPLLLPLPAKPQGAKTTRLKRSINKLKGGRQAQVPSKRAPLPACSCADTHIPFPTICDDERMAGVRSQDVAVLQSKGAVFILSVRH